MNLLLDTHVALWAIADSPRLATEARHIIESPKTCVWISAASVWEISIKHGLGRGDMPLSGQQAFRYFRESGYRFLPIEPEHAASVEGLLNGCGVKSRAVAFGAVVPDIEFHGESRDGGEQEGRGQFHNLWAVEGAHFQNGR